MQIKPNEGAPAAGLTSARPPPAGPQLAPEARAGSVSIALSETLRALTAALTHEHLDLRDLQLGDKVTGADLLVLAKISEVARAEGLDPGQVVKLALDLSHYRARAEAPRPPPAAQLELPAFSARDETLARDILSRVALHAPVLDRGFVRALLDPDQMPEHAVDFEFLRRTMSALSAVPRAAASEPGVTFERRDARAAVARALATLALPRAALPSAAAGAELGLRLLRQRLPTLFAQLGAPARGATPRFSAGYAALTRDDRAVLAVLYAAAHERGVNLDAVDDVACALVRLRALERAPPELPGREPASAQTRPRASLWIAANPQTAPGEPEHTAAHPQTDPRAKERADATTQTDPRAKERADATTQTDPRAKERADATTQTDPRAPERADATTQRDPRAPKRADASPHAEPRADERVDARPQTEPRADERPNARPQTEPRADGGANASASGELRGPPPRAEASARPPAGEPERTAAVVPRAGRAPARAPEAPALVEPPSPSAGGLAAAHDTPTAAADAATRALRGELPSPPARSFGSATQLAARAGGTYSSLAPPAEAWSGAFAGGGERTVAVPALPGQPAARALLMPSAPLDVAGALGLSSLVRDVRNQAARAARARLTARRSDAVRAIEPPGKAASEADAEDPVLEGSSRRKHVRWRLLLSRRRRARLQRHRAP